MSTRATLDFVGRILGESRLNLLLVCVPISIALWLGRAPGPITFALSALALVPLAALIGVATEAT